MRRTEGAKAELKPLPRTRWRDMLLAHVGNEVESRAGLCPQFLWALAAYIKTAGPSAANVAMTTWPLGRSAWAT